jgi:hypothetical protein
MSDGKTAAPSFPNHKDTEEATNPNLWQAVMDVAQGKRSYLTIGKRTINAPNKGRGFYPWPHPNGTAWAVKQYKGFGGAWRPRQASMLGRMAQGVVPVTRPTEAEHKRMLKLQEHGLVYAKTATNRHYWDLTPKGQAVAKALLQRSAG